MPISKETPWTTTLFLLTDASSRYRWCPLKGKAACPGELDIQSMCHVMNRVFSRSRYGNPLVNTSALYNVV